MLLVNGILKFDIAAVDTPTLLLLSLLVVVVAFANVAISLSILSQFIEAICCYCRKANPFINNPTTRATILKKEMNQVILDIIGK
ncbi:MAG TPA: hypothetical protein VIP70_01575 [Nitrososphaeraceae archaeon]